MSFTVEFQQRCRRRERMAEYAAEKVRSMLEPFILEKLYPGTPVQLPNGKWKTEHIIQPHQKKLHERKSINGQTPKHLLFSCVGGETILAGRPIRDWVADHTAPACLQTLFGGAAPEVPYRKGMADLYRVRTRSGREVVVTRQHRFLSTAGWVQLDHLVVGSPIASGDNSNDVPETRTTRGSCGGYSSGLRPDDGLLPPEVVAGLDIWRQLRRTVVGNSASVADNRLSIDDFSSLSDYDRRVVYGLFLYALACGGSLPGPRHTSYQERLWTDLIDTLVRLCPLAKHELPARQHVVVSCSAAKALNLTRVGSPLKPPLPLPGSRTSYMRPEPDLESFSGFDNPYLVCDRWHTILSEIGKALCQEPLPPSSECRGFYTLAEWCRSLRSCFNHTSFWDEIESITFDRHDEFYDIGVPDGEHYLAHGIWNHNSGVGAGKSLTLCAEMMRLLRTYPGIKIVVVTAYDYYFDEFLMPIWYSVLPEDSPHIKSSNKKTRSIILTNGSSIRFKAYDDPDKIKGWQAHVIWIEEGSEIGDGNNDKAYAIWNALLMRLRASRPAYPLRTYITQNPKGHNWLWRIFIKDEPTKRQPLGDIGRDTVFAYDAAGRPKYYTEWEKVTDAGEIFYTIACPSTSNSFIPEGYIDSMLSQMADDPGLRQRMVEGKFNPVNTLVYDYPIFSERTHLISYDRFLEYWDIDEIPRWWRVVVGIDVGGSRSPWAVEFYVQTTDGHWACFDEIYQPGLTWDQICDRIKMKSEGFENISYWIDPISSQHMQGPTNTTVQIEFRHRGISCQTPKGYNKMGGIARVQNFLARDHTQPCPYKDDILNEDENGDPYWENGHAQLYYLTGIPHRVTDRNPDGHSAPGNIKEKGVYRWDQAKARAAKATEEGLSPLVSTKLIDRDDHAQTAEMFFALGVNPIAERTKNETVKRKRQAIDQPNQTPIMYGRLPRQRRK